MNIFKQILDWSEVWSLSIPLALLYKYPNQPKYFKPVIIYLWLALLINLVADVGWKLKNIPSFYDGDHPKWLYYNNYLYNLHSIVRFICFSSFFILLDNTSAKNAKRILAFIMLISITVNFFFEDFFNPQTFSSRLLATEAGVLLCYCLHHFLYHFRQDSVSNKRTPDFWVTLGLSIYVVLNFFLFLFYQTLYNKGYDELLETLWDLHNPSFVIFCIFIAKGFYAARHK